MDTNLGTRIVLSGWHGHDNAGDDATLRVFIDELVGHGPRSLTVLTEHTDRVLAQFGRENVQAAHHYETVGLHGLTHLVKARLGRHLKLLRACDVFVLGGGSLLRDNTTWHNLFRVVDELFWARLFGKRTALYAAGIGPLVSRAGRWLITRAARGCDLVVVRDARSHELLLELGVDPRVIHVAADPGFLLEPTPFRDSDLLARVEQPGTVGLWPSLGFIDDGKDLSGVPRLAAALDELHERRGTRFVSVPLRVLPDEIDDVHVARLVRDAMRHPEALWIHEGRLRAGELKWLASRFEANVTVRLHALIFSLSGAVPTVAVEYEPKVRALLSDLDLADSGVPLDAALQAGLVERVERLLDRRAEFTRHVNERLPAVRASARSCFERFEELFADTAEPAAAESREPARVPVEPPAPTGGSRETATT